MIFKFVAKLPLAPKSTQYLKIGGFITDNHIHNKIHEYLFLGIKPKIITINRYYQYVFL